MLDREGSKYLGRFGELKYLLAPYLVQNAAEQQRFYQLWDEFAAECAREVEKTSAPQTVTVTDLPWYLRYRHWLLALFLVPTLAGLFFLYFRAASDKEGAKVFIIPTLEATAREGQNLQLRNGTNLSKNAQDSTLFTWEVRDATLDSVLHVSNSFHLNWVIPAGTGRQLLVSLSAPALSSAAPQDRSATFSTTVYCATPPSLDTLTFPTGPFAVGETARFQVHIPDEYTTYQWTFGDEIAAGEGIDVTYTFEREGPLMVQVKAMSNTDTAYCFTTRIQQVQVGSNQPFLAYLPMARDEGTQQLRLTSGLWLLFLLPLLFSFPLWYRWWKNRNKSDEQADRTPEELQTVYPIHDTGPYDIPFRNQEGQITAPADFFRIADQLRVRAAGLRRAFDAPETVKATINSGGFPKWRDKAIKRPAAYLLLLRHTDEHQQQDRLLSRLADFLLAREAELTVYYHGGNFDHCWNADYPEGWPAEQLQSRYPDHRLIIGGNAHGLVDSFETAQPRLHPQLRRTFTRWNRRLVITTEPVQDWSFQEVLLHQDFLLYPATTKGILDGIFDLNETEEYEAGNYPNRETELAKIHPEPSYRYRKWETVADHQEYLADDPELFRWLSALAVASQPNWNLTIAIGRALSIEVTHDRLLLLSRIPWLANNRPSHALRFALLGRLSPTDEKMARQCVVDELNAVAPQVKNSFAQTDWTTSNAVQQFALAPANPANKQAIRDLRTLGYFSQDQLAELDQTLLRDSGTATLKSPPANNTPHLDKWLDASEPRPWFTWELFVAMFLCLVSFVLSMWGNDFNRAANAYEGNELPWWQATETTVDEARELNNFAVADWEIVESINEISRLNFIEARLDSAAARLIRALELRSPNDYPIADTNQLVLLYNQQVQRFNFYLRDSISPANWSASNPTKTLSDLLANFTGPDSISRRGLYVRHALGLTELRLFDYLSRANLQDSLSLIDRVEFSTTSRVPVPDAYRYFFDGSQYIDLFEFTPGQLLMSAIDHFQFLDTIAGGTFFPTIEGYRPSERERTEHPELASVADAFTEMPYNLRTEIQPYLKRLSAGERPQSSEVVFPFNPEANTVNSGDRPTTNPGTTRPSVKPPPVTESNPEDPFDQMLLNWRTKKYSRTLVKVSPRNYESELTSYLTSSLYNDTKTAVTSFDNYLSLISRDLAYVTLSNNPGHQSGAQFLRLGKAEQRNLPQLDDLREKSIALIVNNFQYTQLPAMLDLEKEVQLLRQSLSSNGSRTELTNNPSKGELFRAIQNAGNLLGPKTTSTGQFMLFITGYFDEAKQQIVLTPSDKSRELQYVGLQELKDQIAATIPASHVLIIANLTKLPY